MAGPLVLYVEDEENDAYMMKHAFEGVGLPEAVVTVSDGKDAIKYLAGQDGYGDRERYPMPALVLLDLKLPVVSGFQVLEWMRQRPELSRLPVVVFSSSTLAEDKARTKELGAKEFIEKPSSFRGFSEVAQGLRERWLGQV